MNRRETLAALICLAATTVAALAAPDRPSRFTRLTAQGFGDPNNVFVSSLVEFRGATYAGTFNVGGTGGQLWRRHGNRAWTTIISDGFGDPDNCAFEHLFVYNGTLYAGITNFVKGGEIWRSTDGAHWEPVVRQGFGNPINTEIFRFETFGAQLYAMTATYDSGTGFQVWRSKTGDPGSWEQVVDNGFGDPDNQSGSSAVFAGRLVLGTWNPTTGAQLFASSDGLHWTNIEAGGFGSPLNQGINAIEPFRGALYVATEGPDRAVASRGAEVWRCRACDGSDWERVVENGFGNPQTYELGALETLGSGLVYVVGNVVTGLEVWATGNGTDWQQIEADGLGNANEWGTFLDNSVITSHGMLLLGTWNETEGGAVYRSRLLNKMKR